ncbi:MAG: RrF2 family transcriptional regulator [Bacteroidota bacterium]
MKLTEYTDYTLRTLIFLGGHPGRLVTIQQIADSYDISKNHLMKIVHRLAVNGIVETVRGRSGGVRLKKTPEEINIGQVVRSAEQAFGLVECFELGNTRCALTPACQLKGMFQQALEAFFGVLDAYSLADAIRNGDQLRSLARLRPAAEECVA